MLTNEAYNSKLKTENNINDLIQIKHIKFIKFMLINALSSRAPMVEIGKLAQKYLAQLLVLYIIQNVTWLNKELALGNHLAMQI